MSRNEADAWRKVAKEALDAANQLTAESPRAFVNRVYYGLFALAHAMLIEVRLNPRLGFGTWRHVDLPALVQTHLKSTHCNQAVQLRLLLHRMRKEREEADYKPHATFQNAACLELMTKANQLFEAVR